MASNSKLTKEQKSILRDMKAEYPHVKFASDGVQIVCAYYREGSNIRFAFSVMSPDEVKFRRKVGELYAMERVLPDFNDQYAILPEAYFYEMLNALGFGNE